MVQSYKVPKHIIIITIICAGSRYTRFDESFQNSSEQTQQVCV